MASNSFGTIFKVTTWGESHGKAIGAVIDGCPAGLDLCDLDINTELALRRPAKNAYTTQRKESDQAEILSGVFEGKTTGTPISIIIPNQDHNSNHYEPIKHLLRPGHANYTYLEKYGIFDYRGGGRSSARETACRVAASAVAKKLLAHDHIYVAAYLQQMGDIEASPEIGDLHSFRSAVYQDPVHCPDPIVSEKMIQLMVEAEACGDSLGGVIEFVVRGIPAGFGDPVYEKLEANLARAMLSLPASKGFEMGSGFRAPLMKGSEHNDEFIFEKRDVRTKTNHAGGTLGGISTGMPLVGRVAFKPTSSIKKTQESLTINGEKAQFELPQGSRHDPCLAIRAVPVVEAMAALVLVDALLLNRCARI